MADRVFVAYDELASRFESLGDDCEFGLVQRALGAEPLGLLRFTQEGLDPLTDVISTDGCHLFTPEDVDFFHHKDFDEYFFRSRHYNDFLTHTFIFGRARDQEETRVRRIKILSYLKEKLFRDMRQSEKIYVRKGSDPVTGLRRLHAALNTHGRTMLLCVAESDRDHDAGSIEKLGDGLYRGYLDRFKNFARDTPTDLAGWISIMKQVQSARDPRLRVKMPRRLVRGRKLDVGPHATEDIGSTRVVGSPSLRVRIDRASDTAPQRLAIKTVDLGAGATGVVAFSAWVKIEGDFLGYSLAASVDLTVLHSQPVDFSRRGRWQRIWVSAKLPAGRRLCAVAIEARAEAGSIVSVGPWSVDLGPVPRDLLRPGSPLAIRRRAQRTLRRTKSAVGSRIFARRGAADVAQRSARALARKSFIEAEDMLSVALDAAPDDATLLKLYALSANDKGAHVTAVHRWQKAAGAAPDDPMCHAGVIANFREMGHLVFAEDLAKDALRRFPADLTVLTEAARVAMVQSRFAEAIPLLETALRLHGPFAELTRSLDHAKTMLEHA